MTPAARVAAAITVLDAVLAGAPAEREMTNWGRKNRYAGSGDRAAIRDHVFSALRCKRSFAALGGDMTGRGLMIGALRASDIDPATVFTGDKYAPMALSETEAALSADLADLPLEVALDCPDWLMPKLQSALGAEFTPILESLRHRAPIFIRVNLLKMSRDQAMAELSELGIETRPHDLSPTALEVTAGARRVQQSDLYKEGVVELQDAASQALTDEIALNSGTRVLDICAGGGGKTLSMAAREPAAHFFAHDADEGRMRDLPVRAARAGATVQLLQTSQLRTVDPFDVVLCDVPCSGSGAWRRSPEGKWQLTAERLQELLHVQASILDQAAELIAVGGQLAYATCSLLREENEAQVDAFLERNPMFSKLKSRRFTPLDGGDGFYVSIFERASS